MGKFAGYVVDPRGPGPYFAIRFHTYLGFRFLALHFMDQPAPTTDHFTAEALWTQCLEQLSQTLARHSFQTWIVPLSPIDLTEHDGRTRLRLGVPSDFHRDWVKSRLDGRVEAAVASVADDVDIVYEVLEPSERQIDAFEEPKTKRTRRRMAPDPDTIGDRKPAGSPDRRERAGRSASSTAKSVDSRTVPENTPQAESREGRAGGDSAVYKPNLSFSDAMARQHIESIADEVGARLGAWGDPRYRFETFIEGDSNKLSRAASIAVAESPGISSYNPLFIYGDVGLGKTHLAHAIAHRVEDLYEDALIAYVPSNEFVEQFVRAIKAGEMHRFATFYRSVDLLIVDDIQFLSGKEKTQEEFFHLFDELHQRGSQIVLCADRSPQEIDNIGERLLSRFTWGLCTDVQTPDLETRTAIIHSKADALDLNLGARTVEWLATTIVDSIRELEGALNRLKLHSQMGEEVTFEMATSVLQELAAPDERKLTVEYIRDTVASLWQVRSTDLCARTRKREVVAARHVAMYLAREFTSKSLSELGNSFGGRDHSTVISACRSIENRMETEPAFSQQVERARTRLGRPAAV